MCMYVYRYNTHTYIRLCGCACAVYSDFRSFENGIRMEGISVDEEEFLPNTTVYFIKFGIYLLFRYLIAFIEYI